MVTCPEKAPNNVIVFLNVNEQGRRIVLTLFLAAVSETSSQEEREVCTNIAGNKHVHWPAGLEDSLINEWQQRFPRPASDRWRGNNLGYQRVFEYPRKM